MSEIVQRNLSREITTLSASDLEFAQVIYNKITEKTEKTTKSYTGKYEIDLDSIKQIYNKLNQITHSWTTLGPNCDVSVTYLDDTTDSFSSAEKFFLMDTSKASPIVEIAFKYSFLHQTVINENEKPFQPYSVTIRILNTNAVYEKENITPSFLKRFLSSTLIVEFEYVDYMIVKSLISTVDAWVENIEEIKDIKILDFFKKRYNYGGRFFGFLFFVISCVMIMMKSLDINFTNLKNTFVLILLIIFVCTFVGYFIGNKIEEIVDSFISYTRVIITKGDEKLVNKSIENNKKSFIKLVFSFILSIIYNIGIGYICKYLERFIN